MTASPIIRTVLIALVLALVVWVVLGAVGFGYAGIAALITFLAVLLSGVI